MTSFQSIRTWLLALLVIQGLSGAAHAAAPVAPTDCRAKAISVNGTYVSIAINWTDNSTNETAWQVKYTIDNGSTEYALNNGNITSATIGTTGNVAYTWPGATANHVYRFKVIANYNAVISAASNVATVGTYPLNTPINLKATVVDPFNVTLSWEEQSYSEDGFVIERKAGAGDWTCIGNTASNSLSIATQNWIWPWQTFAFRVRAFTGSVPTTPADVSVYSTEASVSASAYTLAATKVPNQPAVNLSWPNIQNEDGYDIFQVLYDSNGNRNDSFIGGTTANITTYLATATTIEPTKTCRFYVMPYIGNLYIGISSAASVTLDGITSNGRIAGNPGGALSHTFTHISGSTVRSRTLTGTPEILTFNAATSEITGVFPPTLGDHPVLYTVNFTDGSSLSQTFNILVRPPSGAPLVGTTIPAWSAAAGATRDTPLAGTFTDAEAESAVRVSTNLGNMDFILFDTVTPATVANFMNYVQSEAYTDVVFHRSIPNFVIQAGGFKGTGTGSSFTSVATDAPVVNESGISNVRGTVAMAKRDTDPNSATSQFFVSVKDNQADLDHTNGGFTVFGRVAGDGMAVADAINALPRGNYTTPPADLTVDGSLAGTLFSDCPMAATTAPPTMDQTKLVKITSVAPIPTLTYSVTGNTQPDVAAASIVSGQLHLVGLSGGHTTLTLTATDLDNLTATQTVEVAINDTYSTWATRTPFPGGQNGVAQNPDGDSLTNLLEYALLGDPAVASQAPLPTLGRTGTAPDARFMTLTFAVRKATNGLSYIVEANNQLSGNWTEVWNSATDPVFGHAQVLGFTNQADRTVVTIKDSAALATPAPRFMRLKVVQY
ncbi:MAG: peptidylprolyl isomerase [Verrucomicrobiota bacterium]